MSDAPKRIWAAPDSDDGWRWPVASKFPMQGYSDGGQVEYVRADLFAALEAQIAAADRLAEAWADFDKPLLKFGSFPHCVEAARDALAAYRAARVQP